MRQLRALDCFSGLGGWSDGLATEGFDVLGIEIEPKIADLYKHRVIVADFTTLNPKDFTGYDLIVGSPPCRNFTKMNRFKHWKVPADPEGEGMRLVNAFLRFVEAAKPTYWLMENVPGLERYLKAKPVCRARLSRTMVRCFWGTAPSFLVPSERGRRNIYDIQGPLRAWERAKIPMPVARALGAAVRQALEEREGGGCPPRGVSK